jgi:membrane protein implicated in regulation of membrane protease activity
MEATVFELAYWHWIVLGVALALLEIFLLSFTILWFGLGALVVGLVMMLVPITFSGQLFLWLIASTGFAILWFRYFKPRMTDKTTAGIAREAAIGEVGQVIRVPAHPTRGLVRFTIPVLGDDEWEFICEEPVAAGDRVAIKDFSGNTLVVTKRA